MAGTIKFLQYQTVDYWRRAFAVKGTYDSTSGFLLLIILGFAFKYVLILNQTANALAAGNTKNLYVLLAIVSLAWILPALESQNFSTRSAKFLHLPLSKNQFSFVNLSSVFLLPTSIIALIVSFAGIYPLAFSKNFFAAVLLLLVFVLISALSFAAFANFLKLKFFRIALFSLAIVCAVCASGLKNFLIADNQFSTANLIVEIVNAENIFADSFLLFIFLFISAFLAFVSTRLAISDSISASAKLNPQGISRLKLPLKSGELIKKDFIYSWQILDCWLSLLVFIFYAVLLINVDFSFQSFSIALCFAALSSGSLAFNSFGLETASGIERLSLLPTKAKDLLSAKNKGFTAVVFSQMFFLFPLLWFKFGAILTTIAVLKTISVILLYAAWGNNLSVRHPFKMNFYQLSFGGSLSAMLYGILTISLFIIVPEFLTAGNIAAKLIVNVLSIMFSAFIYKFFLQKTSRELPAQWENIAVSLS